MVATLREGPSLNGAINGLSQCKVEIKSRCRIQICREFLFLEICVENTIEIMTSPITSTVFYCNYN